MIENSMHETCSRLKAYHSCKNLFWILIKNSRIGIIVYLNSGTGNTGNTSLINNKQDIYIWQEHSITWRHDNEKADILNYVKQTNRGNKQILKRITYIWQFVTISMAASQPLRDWNIFL